MKEIETLDEWIIGRVEPHIYAFSQGLALAGPWGQE